MGIQLFRLRKNPYKKLKSYDNPFWGKSKEGKKKTRKEKSEKISALADGGPRSRVCARETLRSAPHRRERKFSAARVC